MTSSLAGIYAAPGVTAYCAAKHGVRHHWIKVIFTDTLTSTTGCWPYTLSVI